MRHRPPKVRIKWENRHEDGRTYALLRWRENGQTRTRTLGYTTEQEADRERGDLEARLRLRLSPDSTPASVNVARLLRDYLRRLHEDGIGGDRYREQEEGFAATLTVMLGDLHADRVTDLDLRAYAARRAAMDGRRKGTKMARSTIRHELETLRRAWTVAHKTGTVPVPCPALPGRHALPDNARPPRWLSEAEVSAVLRTASAWQPVAGRLLTFIAWCPARPREILALTRDDCARILDPALPREERLLRFRTTKGGEGRGWRPLTRPAFEVLLEHLAEPSPSPWVWPAIENPERSLPYATLYDWLRKAAAWAKVHDVIPYDLRKFGAGRILRATSPADVTRYTGHRDVRTFLQWYAQGAAGEAEAAADGIGWTPAPLELVAEDGD